MDVQRAKVDQLRALYQLKHDQLEALSVRSGADGVLQQLPLQVGQRVTPGTTLAKVVQPEHLKAELKIAETQAKDIQIGQVASVVRETEYTRTRCASIRQAKWNRTVDVKLERAAESARPDLTVDGTVELRMQDVLCRQTSVRSGKRNGWPF
jgi:HlyD family secretion protein